MNELVSKRKTGITIIIFNKTVWHTAVVHDIIIIRYIFTSMYDDRSLNEPCGERARSDELRLEYALCACARTFACFLYYCRVRARGVCKIISYDSTD